MGISGTPVESGVESSIFDFAVVLDALLHINCVYVFFDTGK